MKFDEFHPQVIALRAEEFLQQKRTLILCGDKDEYRIHPTSPEDEDVLLSQGSISRKISIEEAVKLADNPNCKNQPAIKEILKVINAH